MPNSKLLKGLGVTAATFCLVFFSIGCKKTTSSTEDTTYANEQSVSEKSFEDAQTISDEASTAPTGNFAARTTTGSGCATVTHTTVATASGVDSEIVINFPDSSCVCHDGSYRYGTIIVTYSGAFAATGSVHTITFSNFYQNGNQVTGTKTVTNMGLNSSGQTFFNVTINGSVILANGAGTISANWNRTRTWIQQGSPNIYQIYGTGTLTRPNGTQVGVNIPQSTPLEVASDCRWIESGTVIYTLPSGLTRTLDYGNTPVCDAEATLTLPDGKTYNINL